eukprot:TRINITY_DN2976_c0_g1_i2.p1 TRINITY_DN2976_c0_g1~~TRINITY_DN2976_c0_g1_i2.p1  ORF type:complete len:303 (+),score=73.76 TRINITY_DN2976_c0_g1_i2:909-1817(+)
MNDFDDGIDPVWKKLNENDCIDKIIEEDKGYYSNIPINDAPNRQFFTTSNTQNYISQLTGCSLILRGQARQNSSGDLRLFLSHATDIKKIRLACIYVRYLIDHNIRSLPKNFQLLLKQSESRTIRPQTSASTLLLFSGEYVSKIQLPRELEDVPIQFNLRGRILGPDGCNIKYIKKITGCHTQLKGRGSGFIDPKLNREDDHALFMHIAGRSGEQLAFASELALDLAKNVKEDFIKWEKSHQKTIDKEYQDNWKKWARETQRIILDMNESNVLPNSLSIDDLLISDEKEPEELPLGYDLLEI